MASSNSMAAGESVDDLPALRAEIQRLRASLEQAHQGTHEFVAMLAHELRTPLGAILMWAHVLRAGRDNDRDTALDAIENSARAQSQLIGTVLDVTRGVAGRLRIENAPVDLATTTRAAIEDLQAAIPPPESKLSLSISTSPLPVRGDGLRLREMVSVLVRNAIRSSPAKAIVKITVEAEGGMARITVRDHGPGLSPSDCTDIFTPFRMVGQPDRRLPISLGLELPLVRLLADLHGAQVTAHSEGTDQGRTFVLEVPLEKMPEA